MLPTLSSLVRRGLLTPRLLAAVAAAEDEGTSDEAVAEQSVDPEKAKRNFDYLAVRVAAFVGEIRGPDSDEWEPITLAPEEVDVLPPDDQDLLEELVQRHLTPEQVTAISLAQSGEPVPPPSEEVGIGDLATFRDEHGGAPPGGDGEPLGDAAVEPDGPGG